MWTDWLDIWDRHSRSERFARRLEKASKIAFEGAAKGRPFLALSGGKDGVALAAVLHHASISCQAVHCHTELNTPGMLECAENTARSLGLELDIVEPDWDDYGGTVWDALAALPREEHMFSKAIWSSFANKISSGNLLVSYQYAGKFACSFSGLRGAESRGRGMNRAIRGPLYRNGVDGSWMCTPIVDWSARDVFAAAVRFGLPICDHYQLMLERFEVDPESPASRVDCLLTNEAISKRGTLTHCKTLYPHVWRRLVMVRPELTKET